MRPISSGVNLHAKNRSRLLQSVCQTPRFEPVPTDVRTSTKRNHRRRGERFIARLWVPDQAAFKTPLTASYDSLAPRFALFYMSRTVEERAVSSKMPLLDRGLTSLSAWSRDRLLVGRQLVYAYLFTPAEHGPQSARYRAVHSAEIPYVFQTLDVAPDRVLSESVALSGINFVKTGNPNGPGRSELARADAPQSAAPSPRRSERGSIIVVAGKTRGRGDVCRRCGRPTLF